MSVAAKKQNPFYAAIWIDQSRAYIVRYNAVGTTLEELKAGANTNTKSTGGKSHAGAGRGTVTNERRLSAHREKQTKQFFHEVLHQVGHPEELLIVGPGQAKIRLRKEIAGHSILRDKVVDCQTLDKLTGNQLQARVEEYFTKERHRRFD